MTLLRRDILKFGGGGLAGAALTAMDFQWVSPATASASTRPSTGQAFNIRLFGATGDGRTIDTPSINKAIEAAAVAGGGEVRFPVGQYLCYSIRLKSGISLAGNRICHHRRRYIIQPNEAYLATGGSMNCAAWAKQRRMRPLRSALYNRQVYRWRTCSADCCWRTYQAGIARSRGILDREQTPEHIFARTGLACIAC